MAIDTDLRGETFSDECAADFVDYEHLLSTFNDHFELGESLTTATESSKTLAAQSASFKHEKPGKISRGAGYTYVEKLGEADSFLAPAKSQQQFTEKDCALKENGFQLANIQEQSSFESPCAGKDYVKRYVVRSSDHIAKMRDLKPEELAFYSKLG